MLTARWSIRKPAIGTAEFHRRNRVNEAWETARRRADEVWAKELEARRVAASSQLEPTPETKSPWAELERRQQRKEPSKSA